MGFGRLVLVLAATALFAALPASAKSLDRVVLVGADGTSVEVKGTVTDFDNLGRAPSVKARPARGSFVRLYYVGSGDFPANRARYYPRQRCIALDWPTYENSCRALQPSLISQFRRSHALPRFDQRPTVLSRLTHGSASATATGLYGITGSIELALSRSGSVVAAPSACYGLVAFWKGPHAATRPTQLSLCRSGVYASGQLHPLRRGVWEWLRLNVGSP